MTAISLKILRTITGLGLLGLFGASCAEGPGKEAEALDNSAATAPADIEFELRADLAPLRETIDLELAGLNILRLNASEGAEYSRLRRRDPFTGPEDWILVVDGGGQAWFVTDAECAYGSLSSNGQTVEGSAFQWSAGTGVSPLEAAVAGQLEELLFD